jgi:hypothetical protein
VTSTISLSTAAEQLDSQIRTIGRRTNGHLDKTGHVATARSHDEAVTLRVLTNNLRVREVLEIVRTTGLGPIT